MGTSIARRIVLAALLAALAGPLFAQAPDHAPSPAVSGGGTLGIVDFIPAVGHFRRGQWRKGSSDIWNAVSVLWFILEPSTSIDKMERDVGGYRPGSRDRANTERNIRIYRELQYLLLATTVVNYVNSLLDLSTSDDDESFFSAFLAFNSFRYDTHMTMSDGYRSADVAKAGAYSGLNFGYRGVFEVYAKMFLPVLPGMRMQYANFYTDYIIPCKPWDRVDLYVGLGFNAGGYSAPDMMYGGGLGMHPRIGASFEPARSHYLRLNLIPYMFWNEVITKDPSKSGMPKEYYDLRFASQSFGDTFGAEVVHRYRYSKRWFVQTMLDFSHVAEPSGDYVETRPDGTAVAIHRAKESSEMVRADLSLNFQF